MNRARESVAEHVTSPRNAGEMAHPDAIGRSSHGESTAHTTIFLSMHGSVIDRATFQTYGCGYSIAICSYLTELVQGRTMSDCESLTEKVLLEAFEDFPPQKAHCADVALAALHDAIDSLSNTSNQDRER